MSMLVRDLPLKIMLIVYFVYYIIGLFILSIEKHEFLSLIIFSIYTFTLMVGYYMGKITFFTGQNASKKKKIKKGLIVNHPYIFSFKFHLVIYILALNASIWLAHNK